MYNYTDRSEEQEEDYKRASRLYSPKGVNYQTIYQDQASKNNNGIILCKSIENKVLIFLKKSTYNKNSAFIFDNKFTHLKDQNLHLVDDHSKSLLLFLGPNLSVPVIREYIRLALEPRTKHKRILSASATEKQKVDQFFDKSAKEYLYDSIRRINAKTHLDHRQQPVTILGVTKNCSNLFIIKPSNKIFQSPIIYEGDLTKEEFRTFVQRGSSNNLFNTELKIDLNNFEDLRLDLPENLKFVSTDRISELYPEYNIFCLDESYNISYLQ